MLESKLRLESQIVAALGVAWAEATEGDGKRGAGVGEGLKEEALCMNMMRRTEGAKEEGDMA